MVQVYYNNHHISYRMLAFNVVWRDINSEVYYQTAYGIRAIDPDFPHCETILTLQGCLVSMLKSPQEKLLVVRRERIEGCELLFSRIR